MSEPNSVGTGCTLSTPSRLNMTPASSDRRVVPDMCSPCSSGGAMAARLPDRMRVMQTDLSPVPGRGPLDRRGTMERMADHYIEVSLVKRGITATAKLLDDR